MNGDHEKRIRNIERIQWIQMGMLTLIIEMGVVMIPIMLRGLISG